MFTIKGGGETNCTEVTQVSELPSITVREYSVSPQSPVAVVPMPAEWDQLYVNGGVPEVIVTVADPSQIPRQDGAVVKLIDGVQKQFGSFKVTVSDPTQPFASQTVTVYKTPPLRPVSTAPLPPLGDQL
jgi:hypothetical protein